MTPQTDLINKYSKVAEYKISTQNELKEIKRKISFTAASKILRNRFNQGSKSPLF